MSQIVGILSQTIERHCTYSEKFQKQPFKGQKGHLKAMSLTFLSLTKFFWVIFESLCKIMGESENIF